MEEATRTEILPVPLTEAELLARGDEAARIQETRDRKDGERDAANKAAKAEIQGLEETLHHLLRQVRRKSEDREVEVLDRRNEDELTMEVVRTDTGEVIRSRPLTPEELQIKLFPAGEQEGASA